MTIPTLVFCIATLYMYVDLESATALSIFLVFTALFIVIILLSSTFWGSKIRCLSASWSLIGAAFCFCIAIILFLSSDSLMELFYSLFGKSGSLQERVTIWSRAIGWFLKSPIFGMGVSSSVTDIWRLTYNHAHNLILQVLYQGGLVSLLFLIAAIVSCVKIGSHDHRPEAFLLACTVALTIVAGTFDFYFHFSPQFFPLLLYGSLSSPSLKIEKAEHEDDDEGLPAGYRLYSRDGRWRR